MKLLWAGRDKIDPENFNEVKNDPEYCFRNKPYCGGLWCSSYNEDDSIIYTWIDFVDCNDFHLDKYIKGCIFELKPDTKIYECDSIEKYIQMKKLGFIYETTDSLRGIRYCIDWEALSKEYDAFHLTEDAMLQMRLEVPGYRKFVDFYHWDVETYLLFNLDCIDEGSMNYIDLNYEREAKEDDD